MALLHRLQGVRAALGRHRRALAFATAAIRIDSRRLRGDQALGLLVCLLFLFAAAARKGSSKTAAALSRHSSRIAYQLHSACLPAAVRIAARARLDRISEEVRELTCMLSVQ